MRIKKGFTLIEIVITITLIGVMLSIGANAYRSYLFKSRDARRKVDLEQIRNALEDYKQSTTNGVYPRTAQYPSLLVTGQFIEEIPVDPQTQQGYQYTALPTTCTNAVNRYCTSFRVCTVLESPRNARYCVYPNDQELIIPGSVTPTIPTGAPTIGPNCVSNEGKCCSGSCANRVADPNNSCAAEGKICCTNTSC